MSRKLYVTIDTEMDADIHWKKKNPRKFSSIIYGIPYIYRPIWNKYNVKPIYFVSPEVLECDKACRVLRCEISKGAIIGAHLHPDFIEPEKTPDEMLPMEKYPCFGYNYDIEKKKIGNLKKMIETRLGVTPIWYRAARFGADQDTIKIIHELGFKNDSSFTPDVNWKKKGGPDHSRIRVGSFIIKPYGIVEHPVTIIGRRWGIIGRLLPDNWLFYRWLRPTHMTYFEEKRLVKEVSKRKIDELVMMFHSMEVMIGKTPYVRNKMMQRYFIWRLEKTIEFAIKNGYIPNDKKGEK